MTGGMRRLLLIEDSAGDLELVRRSLRSGIQNVELAVAHDGDEAITALRETASAPDLILLDLNLPDMHGREILRFVRSHAALLSTPVIVMTTSDSEREVHECYRMGCNGYLIKPASFMDFAQLLLETCHYWLDVVRLPAARTAPRVPFSLPAES